jgi:hypothetical protein
MILMTANSLIAVEFPSSAEEERDLMEYQPLIKETWPT